jgi:septal ring factor EnvC (AmiA/AmiB activator)
MTSDAAVAAVAALGGSVATAFAAWLRARFGRDRTKVAAWRSLIQANREHIELLSRARVEAEHEIRALREERRRYADELSERSAELAAARVRINALEADVAALRATVAELVAAAGLAPVPRPDLVDGLER